MKIQPLHDRIVVQPNEETVSPGGILIPDQAAERPIRGKVIAVGKGRIMEDGSVRPLDVKPGDCVLFPKYTGTEVKVAGEQYLVMREGDVLARITVGKEPERDVDVFEDIKRQFRSKGGEAA